MIKSIEIKTICLKVNKWQKIKSALLTEIKIEVNAEECNKTSF